MGPTGAGKRKGGGWLFFIPWMLAASACGTLNYGEQFNAQWNKRDFPAMERTLKDWKKSNPKDVEMLVAYGRYYLKRSPRKADPPGPLADPLDGFFLHHPLPAEFLAEMGEAAPSDARLTAWTLQCWKAALRLSPERLDLYLRLARLYQALGDFRSQYDTLGEGLEYADKHPRRLRWDGGQRPPLFLFKRVAEDLQDSIAHYFRQGEPEKALDLAKLSITFYPAHPYAYNSIAFYYAAKQDWPRTLKYLLQAHAKARKNSLVLLNIGNLLEKLGKGRDAAVFYRRVLRLNTDGDCVREAQRRLEKTPPSTVLN